MRHFTALLSLLVAQTVHANAAHATPQTGSNSSPYTYTGHLSLDITKVPFSRYGSAMAFSKLTPENLAAFHTTGLPTGVYLRSMSNDQRAHPVFRVELLKDKISVPF